MRLHLLYTTFSFSGIYTSTFRIFMTYPLPSLIHNVEDILFSKKCSRVSLQQHCFRGEGGANTKSQQFLHQIVSIQIAKRIVFSMFVVARKH